VSDVTKQQNSIRIGNMFDWLTYSMEQSPSWEANKLSVSQEIPLTLWKTRFITAFTSHLPLSWARTSPPHYVVFLHTPATPSRQSFTPTRNQRQSYISFYLKFCLPSWITDIFQYGGTRNFFIFLFCNFKFRHFTIRSPGQLFLIITKLLQYGDYF